MHVKKEKNEISTNIIDKTMLLLEKKRRRRIQDIFSLEFIMLMKVKINFLDLLVPIFSFSKGSM